MEALWNTDWWLILMRLGGVCQQNAMRGGHDNRADGNASTVPGGEANRTLGRYSFAAGYRAHANHDGAFVWGDSTEANFPSTAANQFLIRASGGVGIGTNALNPAAALTVAGTGDYNVAGAARFDLTNTGAKITYFQHVTPAGAWQLATGSATRLLVDSAGNVGIGTAAPGARLEVNGTVRIAAPIASGGAALCIVNFGLIVNCSASSARYKQNITGLHSGLDVVRRLRPVGFTWKESGQRDIGLVAEEVNRVAPLLVTRDAAGNVEGVRYDRLGVILINAVHQQQEQIKRQQAEIEALKRLVCPSRPKAKVCKPKR